MRLKIKKFTLQKKRIKAPMYDRYEPGDLPEFYECMGYTKEEWDAMTNPANY
ncbi:MAG: hypothetical protein PHN69_04470 [Candidatus Pacebacteria bacterium]|nr:hypothetical protein [Fermentimonas sp.]MDD4804408.1 hypothetical protein [Candidatus Paceibacterota bacterium]